MATKPKAKAAPKAKGKTAAKPASKPATKRKGELSDKELDAVAGGRARSFLKK